MCSGAFHDLDGAALAPAVPFALGGVLYRDGCPVQGVQLSPQRGRVLLDQEGDRLRRFRAVLPCEVVVTAVTHPLCGCRCSAARGRGAAFEGGVARWDAGPGGSGGDRCVRRGSGWCGRGPCPGWRWPAPSACCGDAAAGRGCIRSSPVTARGGISCSLCRGGSGQFPGLLPGRDRAGMPDPAQWPPAMFSGVVAAVPLPRRAAAARCPARMLDAGCPRGLLHHGRRARGPPFPAHFRRRKELMGKERDLHDRWDGRGRGVRAAALRRHGPGRGAWRASLQAAWLREPGSGVRAWPDPGVLR